MSGKLDIDWIVEHLDLLTTEAEGVLEAGGETQSEFRELTVLKLSALAAVVDLYSKIAIKEFDRCYYIDALAGPGVTALRDSEEHVIGSPFMVPIVAHREFTKHYLVECDSDSVSALDNRLRYAAQHTALDYPAQRSELREGDCNEVVLNILDEIEDENPKRGYKGVNLLTFFDNSAFNARWDVVEEVANVYGDMLITFNATRISRDQGKGDPEDLETIDEFFGTDQWRSCSSEEEYLELYRERLETVPRVDRVTDAIRVDSGSGGGRFYYYVIYVTRKTSGGSPYMEAIDFVKNRIERLDGGSIGSAVDVFRGDQTGLRQFE